MSRYRKVDPRIWNDAKFCSLSDNGKLAFFFLLTHPHMTALGAMRATLSGLAGELGWKSEAFREAFNEAFLNGMAEHDERACLVWLPNFVKYNQPESPNVIKAWVGALDLLPECDLKNRAIARSRDFAEGMGEAFAKALPEAFAKTMPYQKQKQKQKKKTLSGKPDDANSAAKVLAHLNEKAGTRYRTVDANIRLIEARLSEASEIELMAMIDRRVAAWKGTEMAKYLRPETLFNATKCAGYLGEVPSKPINGTKWFEDLGFGSAEMAIASGATPPERAAA